MAEKGTRPDPAEGARRRKRQAPTIDLTATDVSAQSASSGPQASAAADERDSHTDAGAAGSRQGQDEGREAASARQLILAALAGSLIVTAALLAAWFGGLVPARYAEMPGADSTSIAALNERVSRLEATVANLATADKALPDRLSTAENAMKSLGIGLTALNRRADEAVAAAADARARADAADKAVTETRDIVQNLTRNTSAGLRPSDLDTVRKRLAALEDAIKNSPADRPARLAVIAASLRNAVSSGAAFSTEFNEAKSLGADEKLLAPLAPFAAGGVPSPAAMAHELGTLIPALVKASGARALSGGFLERLQANAEKLVRIRPVTAPSGDDASAVLARLDIDAARSDINGALADLGKLNDKTRAPAQDWINRAQARQTALDAADELAAKSARALEKR